MLPIMQPSAWILKAVAMLLAGVVLLVALREVADILLAFVVAVVIASGVEPAVRTLKSKAKIPRAISILFIYSLIFGFGFLLSYLLIPALQQELRSVQELVPRVVERFPYLRELPLPSPERFLSGLAATLPELLAVGGQIFTTATLTIAVLVVSFYLALHENGIELFLRALTPRRHEERAIALWRRSQRKLGRWVETQLILSLAIAVLTFIGLSLLGVRYALLLALFSGLMEVIPVVGPIVSGAVAFLLTAGTSLFQALFVAGLYILLQQFESHVLVPQLMGRRLGLDPILVIISLLVGARLGGFLGIIAAVPLAMVAVEIFQEFGKGEET